MNLRSILLLTIFAHSLGATTILDVTLETTITMHTGDALEFDILAASFGANARAFGLRYPTNLSFAFVSTPLSGSGSFSGTLDSSDGAVSVAFGLPLTFHDGSFFGAGYQGPASILEGYLYLSPLLAQTAFSGGSAVLTLRNTGADVTIGLSPYNLRQDLFVSLAGGPLSVGGIVGPVNLESQSQELQTQAPEPDSAGLLLLGGSLLCGASLVLARASKDKK